MMGDIEGGELAGDGSNEWRPGKDCINKDGDTKTPCVYPMHVQVIPHDAPKCFQLSRSRGQ